MKTEIKKLIHSFRNAFRGLAHCIVGERNMRIHLVVAAYTYLFSLFYGFDRGEYIQLSIIVALVLTAEVLNTALEVLVDIVSPSYSMGARLVKDIAAGLVLVAVIFAVVLGALLFWRPEVLLHIAEVFFTRWIFSAGLLVSLGFSLAFIFRWKK